MSEEEAAVVCAWLCGLVGFVVGGVLDSLVNIAIWVCFCCCC